MTESLLKCYQAYVDTFRNAEGVLGDMLELKLQHTLRVVSNAQLIADGEGFADDERVAALDAALLHDTGRYEQLTRFNSFNDATTIDHAVLSHDLVKAAIQGGDYSIALTAAEGTSVLGEGNCLHPSSEQMTGDNLFYRLTMHNDDTIGFWWGAEEGAAFTLAEGKAYLAVPKAQSNKLNGLWMGSTITGINAVETSAEQTIYNLQGQRINRLQQGVNIVNGRKVLR